MTEKMNGLLLEDRWAPVTSELACRRAAHGRRTSTTGGRGLMPRVPWPLWLEPWAAGAFTFNMLKGYLHHLGLSPFEEDFYLPQGSPVWLVEKTGPVVPAYKEYTLAQAREDF
jgi:hypothetical protein